MLDADEIDVDECVSVDAVIGTLVEDEDDDNVVWEGIVDDNVEVEVVLAI